MSNKLFLIAGETGAGTTLAGQFIASQINAVFLDKNALTKQFTETMLYVSCYDKDDTQCDFYQNTIKPLEYKTMMSLALDNLDMSKNPVVCVAPFIEQLQDTAWIHSLLVSLEKLKTDLYIVWVNTDIETLKNRFLVRNTVKDQWKIANWEDYSAKVLTQPPNIPLNFVTLNNTSNPPAMLTAQIRELLDAI